MKRFETAMISGLVLAATLAVADISRTGSQAESSVLYGGILGVSPIVLLALVIFVVPTFLGLCFMDKSHRVFRLSLCLEVFAGFVWSLTPFLKGYYFYGSGDPSIHIGDVITITQTTRISNFDPYPLLHVLGATFNYVASIPPLLLQPILDVVFYFAFLGGGILLTNSVFESQRPRNITYMALPAISVGTYFTPQNFAFALIPFLLYLGMTTNVSTKALSSMIGIAVVFVHPFVALFAISALAAWYLLRYHALGAHVLIMALVLTFYVVLNATTSATLASFLENLGLGTSAADLVVSNAIGRIGLFNSASVFARQVGVSSIVALIEAAFVMKRRLISKKVGVFLFLIIFSILTFTASIVLSSFLYGYGRFITYIQFASLSAVGLVASFKRAPTIKRVATATFLVVLVLSTVLAEYPSWYSYTPNLQVTNNEYNSTSWLFKHLGPEAVLGAILTDPRNYWDLTRGTPSVGNPYPEYPFQVIRVGYHFRTVLQQFTPYIIVITRLDRITYLSLYNGTNTFTFSDFETVLSSPRFSVVYSSEDVQLILGQVA
jgi:hypothetical protein